MDSIEPIPVLPFPLFLVCLHSGFLKKTRGLFFFQRKVFFFERFRLPLLFLRPFYVRVLILRRATDSLPFFLSTCSTSDYGETVSSFFPSGEKIKETFLFPFSEEEDGGPVFLFLLLLAGPRFSVLFQLINFTSFSSRRADWRKRPSPHRPATMASLLLSFLLALPVHWRQFIKTLFFLPAARGSFFFSPLFFF